MIYFKDFPFKDSVPKTLWSNLIYKFLCGNCIASYIGKTYRPFKVRVSEHQGVSPRPGKPVKATLSTSVRNHKLVCDQKIVDEDFTFRDNESNRYLLELKESLFIKRDSHRLIRTYTRRSYYCFEDSITLRQILFQLYQLLKYQNILQSFLCHRVNGVTLKMQALVLGKIV